VKEKIRDSLLKEADGFASEKASSLAEAVVVVVEERKADNEDDLMSLTSADEQQINLQETVRRDLRRLFRVLDKKQERKFPLSPFSFYEQLKLETNPREALKKAPSFSTVTQDFIKSYLVLRPSSCTVCFSLSAA